MASCLVPDFPAVMVVLEHLKELDKQLQEEGAPFAPEASLHLAEITAAITELESDRRAAHEHLEVETIENSKLRHQINNIRERMSQDIMADVAAARASNAEEIEQLHRDLNTVSQLQEAAVTRQEVLSSQNQALCPERDQMKAEHEEAVAALNEQISLKYGLQMQLDQTRERTEELKSGIAAVQQGKATVEQDAALEREAFAARKDKLARDAEQADEKIKRQKQAIRRGRREADRVQSKGQGAQDRLEELTADMAKLESDLQRATASRCQVEKQLEGEAQKHQELREQREAMKSELRDTREAFSLAVQRLKEDIAAVEGRMEEGQASRSHSRDLLAQLHEVYRHQHDEEREVRAEHQRVSQQLERSRLQLEERIASIVKHSKETREMDKQIRELLEADAVNRRVFARNQEELSGNMDAERRNVGQLEEERARLRALLEEARREQEERATRTTAAIAAARSRHEELRREEAELRRRWPESADAGLLEGHAAERAAEFRQAEAEREREIRRCAAEAEGLARSNEEKGREAAEKEEALREAEARWSEERGRNQRLKTLTSTLGRRRSELERDVRRLREETGTLLRPRDEMKAELGEMRGSYARALDLQASELRAVEVSVYDSGAKLEQVRLENSRLRLRVRQMTEDVGRARSSRERHLREARRLQRDTQALLEALREAWREDLLLVEERQSADGGLLLSTGSLLDLLRSRRQQLGNVNALLHRKMLDFSKRLGDKTSVKQHS